MDYQGIHHQLLDSLRDEVRRHWGRISEIESEMGISHGYLNRLCSGKIELKLETFLRALDALGTDPRSFLARALDIHAGPEDHLARLEDPAETDRPFAKIARATLELEASEPSAARRGAGSAGALLRDIAPRSRREQLRRLRQSAKYRTHAFAAAYLEHLDSLRYDDAEEAAKLVAGAALHLIPALPGPQGERLRLACRALGVFGSARRSRGRFATAARAFRLSLEVSRRAGLHEETANLLLRASYVLKDHGQSARARAVLREALAIFVRLGSRQDVGRVLVDLGMMNCYLGDYDAAVGDLERALRHLEGTAARLPRYHLASYQFLAYAFEQLGDLEAAERSLARGVETFDSDHAVDKARLVWSRGRLALRRHEYARAESFLRSARTVLASRENALQEAVVALDLLRAMLAQAKNREAAELATGMAPLLSRFTKNRLAEAAIVDLISAAVAGELNQQVVLEARAKIEASDGAPGRVLMG